MGWRNCRSRRLSLAFGRLTAACCLVCLSWGRVDALVISEVMYHPPEAEPDQRRYEFIELYNENPDPQDLSGYSICNGVTYTFPLGTYLDGHTFVVVCADKTAMLAKYPDLDPAILYGSWGGSLDNAGERIEVCNTGGRTVVEVRYNDRGKWSSGADGTGHSLSLLSPYIEVDDPDHWVLSDTLGGSPGDPNTTAFTVGAPVVATHGIDGSGFILWWLMLGPYTGSDCQNGGSTGGFASEIVKDWLRESAGGVVETDQIWHDGQVVQTNYSLARSTGLHPNAGTTFPTIKRYASFSETINLNDNVWPPDPDGVMSYSFVYVDNVTGSDIPVDVAAMSDDGIVVLVNGVRVHTNDVCRAVGGAGTIVDRAPSTLRAGKNLIAVKIFEKGGGWSFRLRLERRGTGIPLLSPSEIQVTTDVDEGLGFDGSGTPILDPGEDPEPPPTTDLASMPPVVINEGFFRTSGARWVELHNRTSSDMDLEGYYLTDERNNLTKSELGPAATVPANGWLALTDTELGLDFSVVAAGDRVFVALVDPSGEKVIDSYLFEPGVAELSEARLPDGVRGFYDGATPTPGAANATGASPYIVINEVMYHAIDDDPEKEYVELYNRGGESVAIGDWALTDGVNFVFPPGTEIPSNDYLVVARSPLRIRQIYGLPGSQVLGPEQTPEALAEYGMLRDRGERITLVDDLGREVDSIRYYDGGDWPRWPDGGGSSMELIDPWQDNGAGQAWDASDDSAKAPVTHFSYVGRHERATNEESELHVILLERGITVVDNLEVLGGGVQRTDTPLIDVGEDWRFFRGTQAPPGAWYELGFNDGGWEVGATGIGYSNDYPYATVLDDMEDNYLTVFCRKVFTIPNQAALDAIDELVLSMIIDDGYWAYLNGSPVADYGVPDRDWDTAASYTSDNGDLREPDISTYKGLLRIGTNVLAVQIHNTSYGSSDLTFIPRLINRTTTIVEGGANQVVNSSFDSSTNGWLIHGTHWRSGVTTTDPIEGAGSLKIVANGRGDNKMNRIETADFGIAALDPTEEFEVAFDARWVVGSPTIHTHGYRSTLAKTHELAVPEDLGTPGAPNSVSIRLATRTGEWNQGPVMRDVSQAPAVPGDRENVVVTVRVQDADGVGTVTLYYSLDDPSPAPQSVSLTPIGGDFYRGTVPGQPLGTKVVFFIVAEDQGGRLGRYPADIRTSTHPMVLDPENPSIHDERYLIYRHDVPLPGTPYHSYRFWMTDSNEAFLGSRETLSNDRVPGSFLYGSSYLYYEANTRFGGSPFARARWGSFRAGLPRDNPLHGRYRKFGMDNHHGRATEANERLSYYLMRNNQGSISMPYSEVLTLVRWQVNGRGGSTLEHLWVPDAQFLSLWFPGDDDGDFLEMDDRFVISDSGGRVTQTDGEVRYPPPAPRGDSNGENKENYRWFFGLRAKNGLDDYSNFIDFCEIMDPSNTNNAEFDDVIFDVCNVEELLRMFAVRLNTSDWDTWSGRRGKNCYFYRPEDDGRWNLIAYDMELTYGNYQDYSPPDNPYDAYNPSRWGEVNRFLNRPLIKRMYYSILDEMVNGPTRWFHSSRLAPYMQRLQAIGMTNTGLGMPGGYIDDRAGLLQGKIQSVVFPQLRLRITTNGGADFTTSGRSVNLVGDAPTDAAVLVVVNNAELAPDVSTTYSSLTRWSITDIPVYSGVNAITVYGLDLKGGLVDSDLIRVTSTAPPLDPPEITALSPPGSLAGDTVEIIGSNFLRGVHVFFGETEVDPSMVLYDPDGPTPDRISVVVPPGTGTVGVKVRNPDKQESNVVNFTYEAPPTQFIRGDANGDLVLDVSDAVTILLYLYSGLQIDCEDAADTDDDEDLTVTDAMRIVQYLFQSAAPPEEPYPGVGPDPGGSALGCER